MKLADINKIKENIHFWDDDDSDPTVYIIRIPKNATNRDIITTLFPDVNVYGCSGYAHPSDKSSVLLEHMSSDWWNAPYKGRDSK